MNLIKRMIKNPIKLFLLLIITVTTLSLKAQLSIGARGGINYASVDFYPRVAQDYIITNHYGAVLRYISEPHFGIQIEANYTERGWRQIFYKVDDYIQRKTNYIEMPVMTHFYLGKNRFRVFLNGGFALSYALSAELDSLRKGNSGVVNYKFDNEVDKRFEFGVLGGGGVEFKYGQHCFLLEGRYYLGLTNLREPVDAEVIDYARNTVINISLTYLFTINPRKWMKPDRNE